MLIDIFAHHRGNVVDLAVFTLYHVRNKGSTRGEDTLGIYIIDTVPLFACQLGKWHTFGHTSVGDQHINLAICNNGLSGRLLGGAHDVTSC